jgi:glutathione S-transferase
MLKLHGMPVSNFYCIVKQALLEKGLSFEEVQAMPNQEPAYLEKSPIGKIPVLETAAGCITETNVILDYLEDVYPQPNLFPTDPFERAKVRQMIKMSEMYLEFPAHKQVNALFGATISDEQRTVTQAAMKQGLAAFQRLAKFSPWICGSTFTAADIFVFHALSVVIGIGGKLYDWDVMSETPGLKAWYDQVGQRPITKKLVSESQVALQEIMKQMAGK